MTEFDGRDLGGARFRRVDLQGADFEQVDLTGARFREVDLSGMRMRGAYLRDVDISGELDGVCVNGIDIGPLIETELDRLHPERVPLRATDPAGYRAAWSFIETLRHLLFATDSWIRRGILGDPSPWDPLDLPWDQMPDTPGVPRDRRARPTLDAVLALRADRMGTVRRLVAERDLDALTAPSEGA